jgi:hypothetical protein
MTEPQAANGNLPSSIVVPFVTVADRAVEIKNQIASHLREICAELDEVKRLGLHAEFDVRPNALGKMEIVKLLVALAY